MVGVFDSITTYVRKWVQAITGKSSLIYSTGNPEVYCEIDTQKAVDEGFNKNIAVYSIVKKDAKKFGSIPRYVYDKKLTEEKALRKKNTLDNDLTKLLNRPNPYQGQDAFFTAVRAFYKICGEGMIWLNRGDVDPEADDQVVEKMPVFEMYPLPSNHVIVVPDSTFWGVSGYMLDVNGQKLYLRKCDVIHWKDINLKFDSFSKPQLRGLPPLSPGYKTLQQNNDATNASVRMYQNDGAKGVLTNETLDKLKPEQESKIRDIIDSKINSNNIKGAVAALQGKWAYLNFGGTSVDMQLLNGKELTWKELCFLFGMPYEFFDSHTPYAEKQLAQMGWVTNEIIPDSKQLDGELNRVLLKAFGLENKAFIACDYWDLPEMQEVRKNAAEGLMKLWPVYPNEVREAIGYEPHPDPTFDEPWVPMGLQPLSQKIGDDEGDRIMQDLMMQDNVDKDNPKPSFNGKYRGQGKEKVPTD